MPSVRGVKADRKTISNLAHCKSSAPGGTGNPELSQITWRIVMTKKRGAACEKKTYGNPEITGVWVVGCGSTRTVDSKHQLAPVLEPNTNAQELSLLSYLLRSPWATLGPRLLQLDVQSLMVRPSTLALLRKWVTIGSENEPCTFRKI